MDKNSVLSYSPDEEALVLRQRVLRDAGMKVISVLSPAEARFEIEMGRCGNLLVCYRLSPEQADDITRLFRHYCPEGRIVFVTGGVTPARVPPEADFSVTESSGPKQILQAIRAA